MMPWEDTVDFAKTLEGVALSSSYDEPSLKIGRALLSRLRRADNSIVLKGVDPDERDELIARSPAVFFLENHHAGYDIVFARLDRAELSQIAPVIERAWRKLARGKDLNAHDQQPPKR